MAVPCIRLRRSRFLRRASDGQFASRILRSDFAPMDESVPVIVLVTFADMEGARCFSEMAVSEQLAACVNLFPGVESIYRWNNAVERSQEVSGVVKTTEAQLDALEKRYREMHSYEVPEFLVLPVLGGGADYITWLTDSVSRKLS